MSTTRPNTTPAAHRPLPANTHADAVAQLRRPFAPGAVGLRAMQSVPLDGNPYAGAQIATYISAQSCIQRLNAVVPGHWRMTFAPPAVSPVKDRTPGRASSIWPAG